MSPPIGRQLELAAPDAKPCRAGSRFLGTVVAMTIGRIVNGPAPRHHCRPKLQPVGPADKAAKSWDAGPKADLAKLKRWKRENVPAQQGPAMMTPKDGLPTVPWHPAKAVENDLRQPDKSSASE